MNKKEWTVYQGQYESHPLFVRANVGLKAPDPKATIKVGFAVPLRDFTADGLPTSAESEALYKIEDLIESALSPDGFAKFAVVITTNGMREWVFYTSNSELPKQAFEKLRPLVVPHELQFIVEEEPNWDTYKGFVQ